MVNGVSPNERQAWLESTGGWQSRCPWAALSARPIGFTSVPGQLECYDSLLEGSWLARSRPSGTS
jgi:hypothetical protein